MRVWLLALVTGSSLLAKAVAAADLAAHYAAMTPPLPAAQWHIHDPSRILTLPSGWQIVAATGKAQEDGYRCGLETWVRPGPGADWQPGQCLLIDKPAWVSEELPENDGAYWAPSLLEGAGGLPALAYAVANGFEDDSGASCVGLALAEGDIHAGPPRLSWRDYGHPLTCVFGADGYQAEFSTIDPVLWKDPDGHLWLMAGGGLIHASRLDPQTRLPVSGDWFTPYHPGWTILARGPRDPDAPGGHGWVEAAQIHRRGDWHYLFVNWGACCRGVDSTYEIRIGRSRALMGPYLDRQGRDLAQGGGSLLLASRGRVIGPGHAGLWTRADGVDVLSFHAYDAERDGLPWIEERALRWVDGWPEVIEP